MTEIPCLQTPRLTLRPFVPDDAPVLYRINQREGVLRYFPGTTPPLLVGFLLDSPYWGKGYATEAARASLQYGFDHFDFPHIIALVHPENLASRRVIAKCGMTYVETIHLWDTDLMRHTVERADFNPVP